jgi:hypothetical protein
LLYGQFPALTATPELVATLIAKRMTGVLAVQLGLKAMGLRDDINLLEVAAAGAAIGVSAQISSLLGPAVNSTVPAQTAIALGANVVTQLVLGTPIDVTALMSKSIARGIGVISAGAIGPQVQGAVRDAVK